MDEPKYVETLLTDGQRDHLNSLPVETIGLRRLTLQSRVEAILGSVVCMSVGTILAFALARLLKGADFNSVGAAFMFVGLLLLIIFIPIFPVFFWRWSTRAIAEHRAEERALQMVEYLAEVDYPGLVERQREQDRRDNELWRAMNDYQPRRSRNGWNPLS